MARGAQRQSGARGTSPRNQRRPRHHDEDGILPVLARVSRDVEAAVQRGRVKPSVRTKFQVAALLMREERARVKVDDALGDVRRDEQLKRLDGIATILAKTAARDTSLLALLDADAVVTDAARALKRDLLEDAGLEVPAEEDTPPEPAAATTTSAPRQVVPQSVVARQRANPFLEPDFSAAGKRRAQPRLLAGWELL
ncbi:ATP-dependent helicase, partial [Georgenia sp. 10Sc9-8]|nr:ATP-dependent helicase [Georgenia halotolerans]